MGEITSNTAIIFATNYGTTEKVAEYLAENIVRSKPTIFNVKDVSEIDLSKFDTVILGGSVYLGDIQKEMSDFCAKYTKELLEKKLGLFLCGIEPEMVRQDEELKMAYPKALYNHAQATAFVGGEIHMELLNPSQKFITQTLLGIKTSSSFLQYDLIDIFICQMELNDTKCNICD